MIGNWPYGPPVDAELPDVAETETDKEPENSDEEDPCDGCVISPQQQSLGESVDIAGTGHSLHYESKRAAGARDNRAIIPLTDEDMPESVQEVQLELEIAGRSRTLTFDPVPDQTYELVWDGKDAFGRKVFGNATVRVKLVYIYPCIYHGARGTGFARFGDVASPIGTRNRCQGFSFPRRSSVVLESPFRSADNPIGNWTVSVEHGFRTNEGRLVRGDGMERTFAHGVLTTVSRFAVGGLAVDERGNLYIADNAVHRIVQKTVDGEINIVAGTGERGFSGDGGSATQAKLHGPTGVAIAPDGSLYIADRINDRVRRVTPAGIIETVAGNGERGFGGDGGPATEAKLNGPTDLAIGVDGSLYIADQNNHRVRRVGTDGVIETVAGNGQRGFSGDGGAATEAELAHPDGVEVDPAGVIYIADRSNLRVRRVTPDGRIDTVAGTGESVSAGDDGPATEASFSRLSDLALAADGSIYIAARTVRRVAPDGSIDTVAGNGQLGFSPDGTPALDANLSPTDLTLGPKGDLIIADGFRDDILRVGGFIPPSGDIRIPSEDGSRIFVFSPAGIHLRTEDTRTGGTVLRFERNTNHLLTRIIDGDGNVTIIERDSSGAATGVVAPDGQRTQLEVDSRGYLTSLADPTGAIWSMEYTGDGLLTRIEKPGVAVNQFAYDDRGRLISDVDPNGGGWQISRTELDDGYRTEMVTGEGRVHRFTTERPDAFTRVYTKERPDGTIERRIHTDSDTRIERPDGSTVVTEEVPDPRFDSLAPYVAQRRVELPSGQTLQESRERSVQLTDPDDPLSLEALDETVTTNGRTSVASYDALDRRWTFDSPEGRTATTLIDDQGRPLEQSVPGLARLRTSYDARGRLRTIAQGSGTDERRTVFSYHDSGSQAGYLASITDASGRVVSFDTDATGRVTEQTLPDGRRIGYQYDARGNLIALTPPGRAAHVFEYDGLDQRTRYAPPDLAAVDTVTRHVYNLDRQIREIHRPGGETIGFDYDAGGRLATRSMPVGETAYGYDPATGRLTSIQAPGGIGLQFGWDGFLPTRTTWNGQVAGSVEREFDSNFWLSRETVNGRSVEFDYDEDGLLMGAGSLEIERDPANGLLQATRLAGIGERTTYNAFGEVQTVATETAGELAQLTLDVPDTTDSGVLEVSGSLPGASRLQIGDESFAVDTDGSVSAEVTLPRIGENVLEVTVFGTALPDVPLAQRTVSIERTEAGTAGEFPVAEIFDATPDDGIYVRAEDGGSFPGIWLIPRASGVPEQPSWPLVPEEVRVDPTGTVYLRTGTQILDTSGSLIVDFASGGAGVVEEFAAAAGGALFARTSADELFLARDGAIHLLGSLGRFSSGSIDIAASAWGVGLLTPETVAQFDEGCVPSGGGGGEGGGGFECFTEWFRAFPSFRFALSVSDSGAACYTGSETLNCRNPIEGSRFPGFFAAQFELGSDDLLFYLDGNVLLREIAGGESESVVKALPDSGGGTTTGEMVVTGSVTDGENLYSVQFQRDRLGRIVEETETIGGETHTWGYEYDQAGRLIEVQRDGTPVHLYDYDANGNRTSHTGPTGTDTGSYDAQDRITAYGDTTYTHTPAGERATKMTPEGTTTYDYDAAGNLREVVLPDGTTIEYLIDGRDRRVGKIVDGEFQKGWLYRDQLNPVAEVDEIGNVVARFVYADKPNVPAYMIRDGSTYRIVSDHLGSVRLVIDTETNGVVQRLDYSPFGEVTNDTNPMFQPFGFAGGMYERDTALVRFGARDYDPEIGRWTVKDPINFAGGNLNLYGYTLNDPIQLIDLNGLSPTKPPPAPPGDPGQTLMDMFRIAADSGAPDAPLRVPRADIVPAGVGDVRSFYFLNGIVDPAAQRELRELIPGYDPFESSPGVPRPDLILPELDVIVPELQELIPGPQC